MATSPAASSPPIIYAERLKTLQRHSETNKWLAGGFSALIFFTYDKIDCQWLRIIESIICLIGIIFLFIAFILFKSTADSMIISLERANDNKAKRIYHSTRLPAYPKTAEFCFIWGAVLFGVYAILFFFVNEFACKKKEKEKECNCIVQVKCDTIKAPPCPPIEVNKTYVLHDVLFDNAKWDIRKESKPELDSVVQMLKLKPQREIAISAHTDSIGSFMDNIILSNRRAEAVKKYIVLKGVNENRIMTRGYGEIAPVESNADSSGRQLNRRVEFTILKE